MRLAIILSILLAATACEQTERAAADEDDDGQDTGADADSDGDGDSDGDADSDGDSDGDSEPIDADCSSCNPVGGTLANMICAIDLCEPDWVLDQDYDSPTDASTSGTYAAVERFGYQSNDLEPLLNDAYALMATGPAEGTSHSEDMGGEPGLDGYASDGFAVHDVMEWSIALRAPEGANGFAIHYVFFSEEYDEWVGSPFNDKFYILIEADSTNYSQRTVINYTQCRDPGTYSDFVCDEDEDEYCEDGVEYCYIAINTALSECCWYDGCPDGSWSTDISGTGFSCANSQTQDSQAGAGKNHGSSTGWLVTQWPIEPGEEFEIIFHIHDTSDGVWDSEVILDKFQFLGEVDPGTEPYIE